LPLYFLRAGEVRHKAFDQIYTMVVRDGKPEIVEDWKNCHIDHRQATGDGSSLRKKRPGFPGLSS
jgi:hypothetical protein